MAPELLPTQRLLAHNGPEAAGRGVQLAVPRVLADGLSRFSLVSHSRGVRAQVVATPRAAAKPQAWKTTGSPMACR